MGPRGTTLVTTMPLVDKRLILLRHVDTHTLPQPRNLENERKEGISENCENFCVQNDQLCDGYDRLGCVYFMDASTCRSR